MATLLYVEDHPPAQLLMQAIISELTPHQLICVGTGEAARHTVAHNHIDLYILDFDLPDTDGLTLAQALTTIQSVPVVLVSAYAEGIKTETLAHHYLAKPLDPDNVAKIIQRALAG
jgi:two-component system, OmpR family, sensor histidine kinase TorS